MDLLVLPDGTVRAIYAEDIDLTDLGSARHQTSQPCRAGFSGAVAGRPEPGQRPGSRTFQPTERGSGC